MTTLLTWVVAFLVGTDASQIEINPLAITGKGVYGDLKGTEPLLLVRSILASQPTLADYLPPAARELIQACLVTDVAARPRTAAEVADRIAGLASSLESAVQGQ